MIQPLPGSILARVPGTLLSSGRRFGYVINEIQSTVTSLAYKRAAAQELQTISTLPENFQGNNSTAKCKFIRPKVSTDRIAVTTASPCLRSIPTKAPVDRASLDARKDAPQFRH